MAFAAIKDAKLTFHPALITRSSTTHLILHHAAAETLSVAACHQEHKNRGWSGIGYNFYIQKNGDIYCGRGWDKVGAHTENYNSFSVGICCEGNYETNDNMPQAQKLSVIQLIADACAKYPTIKTFGGHREFGATACPGRYMPCALLIQAGKAYGGVYAAANTLQNQGIVNTPSYWYQNFYRLDYTGDLIVRMANAPKVSGVNSIGTVSDAIDRLSQKGVITTADYWLQNYGRLQYLGDLLMSAAKKI